LETSWGSGESTENPMIWSGDTDNDGHIEIITSGSEETVYALNWNGTSWNEEIVANSLPSHPYAIAVGDLDNDGIDEIGIGLEGTDAYIYKWNGTDYTQLWHNKYTGEQDIIEAMYIGDADNDNQKEILIGTNIIHVLSYNNGIYEEESIITQTEGQLAGAIIADMDDDGENEVKANDIIEGPGKEWILEYQKGWLSITPENGTILIGDSTQLELMINTTGLEEGNYYANIIIQTNDLDDPVVVIPVNLTVVFGNDMGVVSVNSPSGSQPMGSFIVNATVENFGSLPQSDVVVNCSIMHGVFDTFLDEDFSDGVFPDGWSQEESNEWRIRSGSNAGGVSPEMYLYWNYIVGDYAFLDSIPVNTVGAPSLTFSFNHMIDWYEDSFYCRVYTRADGGDSWSDVTPWVNPVSGNVAAEEVVIDITGDVGVGTQVRFEFDGDNYDLNNWYIDDVRISSESRVSRDVLYSAEASVDLLPYGQCFVEFSPSWNPIDVGFYAIEVRTMLEGDQDLGNDGSIGVVELFLPGFISSLSEGWNFVSLPFNSSIVSDDLLVKFDGSDYNWSEAVSGGIVESSAFWWNTSGPWYDSMFGDDVVLDAGMGYWLYVYEPCMLWVDSLSVPDWDGNISVLSQGWNGLGIPTLDEVMLGDLTITMGSVDYNWSEAVSLGLVESSVFWWNISGPWYNSLSGVDALLVSGRGYWFYTYYDCVLKN